MVSDIYRGKGNEGGRAIINYCYCINFVNKDNELSMHNLITYAPPPNKRIASLSSLANKWRHQINGACNNK